MKFALVTGASSGIGRSVSIELAKNGFDVALASRSIEKLDSLSNEISSLNLDVKSYPFKLDITNENDVKNLFNETSKIGFVDTVINNAGFGKFSKIQNTSTEDWDSQINTNLRGSFLISREYATPMIEKKEGTLLFLNSVAGKHGYPYSAAYVSSKYGMRGLADSLRNELREHNIRVMSVHPGAVSTEFWDEIDVDFPKDEMLTPDDIASSIVHAINSPKNSVTEEIVIRRVGGDF